MLRSMTGFGKAEATYGSHRIEVEIKCQNHRFKEIIMRMPKLLQPMEQEIKTLVGKEIQRGRVEVVVFWDRGQAENSYRLEPNMPFIFQYVALYNRVKQELGLSGELTVTEILREPEAILRSPEDLDIENLGPFVMECVKDAIRNANNMREREGGFIANDFLSRLRFIEERLFTIEERAKGIPLLYKERLTGRLKGLLDDVELDRSRLEMEVALMADKSDITEEIVRIKSHLSQFKEIISGTEPVGRKLEFLIQELHREVTTIANKAQDSIVSQMCVDIKAELEKLREQSQNIE